MNRWFHIDLAYPVDNKRVFGGLHIWLGPIGLHFFYPDFWHSQIDYERDWR